MPSLEVGSKPHRKKKVREFPVPSRDITTKFSLGGNNDIPAGDGKLVNLFLRCTFLSWVNPFPFSLCLSSLCVFGRGFLKFLYNNIVSSAFSTDVLQRNMRNSLILAD
jgi:hypothetical protein